MPTGYTWEVANGEITELEPFVWRLARGMGALVMMRDAPTDAPIPERFEPSAYNAEQLAEARARRDLLRAMTAEQAEAAALAAMAEYERDRAKAQRENTEQRARYEAMIAKLHAWQGAPEGIKEFGLKQLSQSIEFDCPLFFKFYRDPPPLDGEEWRAGELAKVERDILYHAKTQAEEDERTEQRNLWLAQLRRSLAAQGTSAFGQDAQRLEAKPAGAVPAGDAP